MAITNHERVGKALEMLKAGLGPFVEREIKGAMESKRLDDHKLRDYAEDPVLANKPIPDWDVAGLLKLMWETWNEVFRKILGPAERSLVGELRGQGTATESAAAASLKPWREIVTPHKDVASGRYQQAEFAADLWQVHLGEGTDEYRDPVEFFRRTYLTESLKGLLVGAIHRLACKGGDPVVQLQTNFGGGKTHSMLALYHLFSGGAPTELAGIDTVMQEAGATQLPKARRVVLVGNKISPGNPVTKEDGTAVRTLWGELAWQLGGKKAFAVLSRAAAGIPAGMPGQRLRKTHQGRLSDPS